MAREGKRHELGMLKIEKKMHILAWKEEGVLSENDRRLRRSLVNCLVAKAKNFLKFITPLRKKFSGSDRKMDKTLTGKLKSQA
jgi:hypothetical protein